MNIAYAAYAAARRCSHQACASSHITAHSHLSNSIPAQRTLHMWFSTSTSQKEVRILPQDTSSVSQSAQHTEVLQSRQNKLLLRDFIHNSLYHPTKGYFNRPTPVVGHLPEPINYWSLANSSEWKELVSKKYKELGTAWLTPAELFSPWYGHIMARHIIEHRKHNLKLASMDIEIIEVGAGNGTLAKDILDWLRTNKPNEYARTKYTSYEISSRLAMQQYEMVAGTGGHAGKFHVVQGNAWDRSTWGTQPNYTHCFIILMEVLDNLPHDRVHRAKANGEWQQAVVQLAATDQHTQASTMESGPWVESLEPITDDLVARALPLVYTPPKLEQALDKRLNRLLDFLLGNTPDPDLPSGQEVVYLPTACLALLDLIHSIRPNHSLIAADFDRLPDVKLPGRNAPLVSSKVDGRNIDHDTLLVPWGTADIFFPTDFDALSKLYMGSAKHIWGNKKTSNSGSMSVAHYAQGAVLKRYAEMKKTSTLYSFNPMVNDFTNARFFFGDSYNRKPAELVSSLSSPGTSATLQPTLQLSQPALGQQTVLGSTQGNDTSSWSHQTIHSDHVDASGSTESPVMLQPAAKTIDFSWQYGYGKGLQDPTGTSRHGNPAGNRKQGGPTQQASRTLHGPMSSDTRAGEPTQKQAPRTDSSIEHSGQSGSPPGSTKSRMDNGGGKSNDPVNSHAAGKQQTIEPVLGGRHLRKKQQQESLGTGKPGTEGQGDTPAK